MALVMTPELVSRYISCLRPVVSTAAFTFLGAAATFAPQALRHPAIEIAQREIGEFAFHNGALLPHQQYLYGVDQSGESHIVGKKLAGQDYSAWEAEYAKFPRLGSQTSERPGAKVTYSWSLEAPETSTSPIFWQILLWLVFALFCAAVLRYLAQRGGNGNRFVPELTRELIRKYQEGKSQILSLTERVFHLTDNIRKTRKMVRRERKKRDAARTAILRMKSKHDRKFSEQQTEIDRLQEEFDKLQQKLDSILESSGHTDAEGETTETDNAQAPPNMDQPETSMDPATDHEDAAAEAGDGTAGATGTADEGQDEQSPAVDEQDASLGDVDPRDAGHQDDGPSTPNVPGPRRERINRRKDGTIRSTNHPDYVPREQNQNRGRGGRGRGGNRGGRGGRFGWRGGRGGGYGPYDQGRGMGW